ncbi:hypothetical protein Pfo_023235 [Paulownia fortunei]|nr:hypothetical protein Pfo_023235 [Paulownia fortunei]
MNVSDEPVTGDRWISRRRTGACERRWSGNEPATTPLSEWKFYNRDSAGESRGHQGAGGGVRATVSARKLAASLWQLAATTNCSGDVRWQCGLSDRLGFEFCSPSQIPKFAMEGATKWDYGYSKASGKVVHHFSSHVKLLEYQEIATISVASDRQAELFKDQNCIKGLKAEQGWSRTRLKHCMKKLDEEGASWMTTEHQQMCAIVKDLMDDVRRERKNCEKMYILNSKLLSDIAEAKSSARKFMHNYEKEKKSRDLFKDVCIEKAKEVEANKAKIRELRTQYARIQEEVEEERKMLQIAEALREERAQMKLVDAKLILEDKYCQMNNLIADLKAFLRSSNFTTDMNEMSNAKVLGQAFDPGSIQGIEELIDMLRKSDKEFTIVKDAQTSCAEGRSVDHCFSHDQA